ncbi:unnamed protein product [Didymodactylos carnosus]|uniref:Uncharacterized protein n=1 Tax=Didymodactylos carnosus TaxID=1234261 RepID=A0A8S2VV32_9BILA|nr:unnamed protein product [Didymodactylos carnosus]CAF4419687.1 unnamed protein product [Didymodactylos carnosus]
MHSGAGDSYSTATTSKIVSSSSQYDDIHHNSDRLFEIKNSLAIWRNILLPLNNLLEWEHKYDPLILFGLITIVFASIYFIDESTCINIT